MNEELLNEIVDFALSRYPGKERVDDWADLLTSIEYHFEIELPEDMLHPDIKSIQRAVRKAKREY